MDEITIIRDYGATGSASAHCRVGDRLESQPQTASQLKMLKTVSTATRSGARQEELRVWRMP